MIIEEHKSKLVPYLIVDGILLLLFTILMIGDISIVIEEISILNVTNIFLLVIYIVLWFVFITDLRLYKEKNTSVNRKIFVSIHYLVVALLIVYFVVLFLTKYNLLSDISFVTYDKIINGQPTTAATFARLIYKELRFLLNIYGGLNSELVLLFEIIACLVLAAKSTKINFVKDLDEDKIEKFLFSNILKYILLGLSISSFLELNVFQIYYSLIDAAKLVLILLSFIICSILCVNYFIIQKKQDAKSSLFNLNCFYSFLINILIFLIPITIIYFVLLLYQPFGFLFYKTPLTFLMIAGEIIILIKAISLKKYSNPRSKDLKLLLNDSQD
jgi:hypothetical protein